MLGNWLRIVKGQPPFIVAQHLLNKLPARLFRLGRFHVLDIQDLGGLPIRGVGTIRDGTPDDIPALCQLQRRKRAFTQRFAAGDRCLVAEHQGEIVGYLWYTEGDRHEDSRFNYTFAVPAHSIFGYDCYIAPRYRLRGTWLLLQQRLVAATHALGRSHVTCHIDYGNTASLKAHLRLGYALIGDVIVVRVGSRCFSHVRREPPVPASAAAGTGSA